MLEASVIIRTFNEEKHLARLFDMLSRQTLKAFETIVVDSGSLDRTRDIAGPRADQLIRISSHDFTFGYSLNVGIRAAQGRFAVIVSAHTIPSDEHWLERLVAPLRDGKVAMVYGKQRGVPSSKFSENEDFIHVFGERPRTHVPPDYFGHNANSAIRRDLWEQRPFDEALTGLEDIDWARHWMDRGYQVRYEPDAALLHIHEESWRQIRRRFYREAVALRHMGLVARRRVLPIALTELAHAATDAAKVVTGRDNPTRRRLSAWNCLKEIALYRANKTYGTLRGLLEAHPLETPAERETVLFDRSCEAVVISAPRTARLSKLEIPEIKPGDVLIRVAHVGVCATDHEIFNGTLGYFQNGLASYPIVPGHEFSGTIAQLGTNVTNLAEGDRVVVECIQSCGHCEDCRAGNFIGCAERTELGVFRRDGAYAGYVVAPARFVHRVSDGLGLDAAAMAEPLAVVLKGMRRIEPLVRERLAAGGVSAAVVGAGPIGHICAKVLAHRGFAVTVFDRSAERLDFLAGGSIAIAQDLSLLRQFPVIVEATGDPAALHAALHAAPANAVLLLLGLPYGTREFSFEAVAAYDKMVVGSVGSTAEDFDAALALMPALDLSPLLGRRYPLSAFQEAWKVSRQPDVLKVILDVAGEIAA